MEKGRQGSEQFRLVSIDFHQDSTTLAPQEDDDQMGWCTRLHDYSYFGTLLSKGKIYCSI